MNNQYSSRPFYIKLACVLFSLIAIVYIVILAKEILSPLIFSCLFSIVLLPLATFLEKRLKLPRSMAAMTSVILLLSVIGVVIYFVGNQVTRLASDWPQFKTQLDVSVNALQTWIETKFHI